MEVQSDEDVTLFYENRPVVVKGGNGRKSVMTGLQPYAENRISIDIDAVPIDAEIDAAEKHVVPGYRQAVKVDFAGTGKTPVTVAFVGRDGAPLPAGLDVAVDSVPLGRTGYDGLAYFPDLTGGERVRIRGKHRRALPRQRYRSGPGATGGTGNSVPDHMRKEPVPLKLKLSSRHRLANAKRPDQIDSRRTSALAPQG